MKVRTAAAAADPTATPTIPPVDNAFELDESASDGGDGEGVEDLHTS